MKKLLVMCAAVLMASSAASASSVLGWDAFVIRGANTYGTLPQITETTEGKVFATNMDGQKAAWGTNLVNDAKVGDIQSISITRGSGTTGSGPYLNLWVADSLGNHAVLALPAGTYDITWDFLKTQTAFVYEASSAFVLPSGTTFNDFANYTIAPPTAAQGGTGAPHDLNAVPYTAYGVNWVFGDTQNSFTGNYTVSNPNVTAVPLPAAAGVGFSMLGGFGMLAGLRKRFGRKSRIA